MDLPKWTVLYNIVSEESKRWVGTGHEFFDEESDAQHCFDRHVKAGNQPTKRPFYLSADKSHLGAVHKLSIINEETRILRRLMNRGG